MSKERNDYRHSKHEEMIRLISLGMRDTDIAIQLCVGRPVVARVRDIMGVPRSTVSTTREAKLARFRTGPDSDGHTGWTGRRTARGAPAIRQFKVEIPASHVAFQLRTGRTPVGLVKAECGRQDCLTPAHLSDEVERLTLRMQERELRGLPPVPWDVCPKETHAWEEAGRLEPDLTPYCKACNTERAARVRNAKKEAAKESST